MRPELNYTNEMGPAITDDLDGYGAVALFVGGTSTVRFKDVSFKDLAIRLIPPESISSRFRLQRLEEFSYAWGAATADFNRDGALDITSGPYIYFGPDFTKRREVYIGAVATGYPREHGVARRGLHRRRLARYSRHRVTRARAVCESRRAESALDAVSQRRQRRADRRRIIRHEGCQRRRPPGGHRHVSGRDGLRVV